MGTMSKSETKRIVSRAPTKKRSSQWIMSADVPTDIVVEAGASAFSLHKFPLVARCGRIRRAVAEAREMDLSRIQLPNMPGGADAFELAAKFCYGINFEITAGNVAALRCAAEFLEMTEDYGHDNLIHRTEAFISDIVLPSFANSVVVLRACEDLLPIAEETRLIARCAAAIASIACLDRPPSMTYNSSSGRSGSGAGLGQKKGHYKTPSSSSSSVMEWWAEDLTVLRVDLYKRVLEEMRRKGVRVECIWGSLMHYAQEGLKGLSSRRRGSECDEQEQRALVETIVALLPSGSAAAASPSFLFGLLRTSIILDASVACRSALEKRIAMSLDQATLDDLLVPSLAYAGADTLFDVDIVQRILSSFLELQQELEDAQAAAGGAVGAAAGGDGYDSDSLATPPQSSLSRVAKLVDSYLAEIAPDANLKLSKFIGIAELVPEHARMIDDGLYRAVDIYLKAHPCLGEQERRKVCKLLNAQKLSADACTHASQNERLPPHFAIQVLFFEQMRLRNEVSSSLLDCGGGGDAAHFAAASGRSGTVSAAMSPRDNYASLRRENRELKMEIARMRMRLSELERSHCSMKHELERAAGSAAGNFILRRLHRLNPFGRKSLDAPRNRRHSYS